jgi:hypothetical protein
MTYTLSEAAEVTGRSRGAILRALQTGEITATHNNEAADEWTIEPDDLFRVFPVAYHIRFVLEAVEPLRSEIRDLRSRLEAAEAAISATGERLDAKSEEQPPAPPAPASPNPPSSRWWRLFRLGAKGRPPVELKAGSPGQTPRGERQSSDV